MKKRRYVCLILVLTLLLSGCKSAGVQDKVSITVITKATNSDFWKTVRNGCHTAAREYNVDLVFQGPDNEEDFETQNKMIEKAIADGTDAIVLSAIDREKLLPTVEKAAARGIYIVIIDSGINSTIPEVIISTDNYASGVKAAEAMLKEAKEPLEIGIVNFAKGTANGQEREKGFADTIEKAENARIVDKVYVDSNLESAQEGAEELLKKHPNLNGIIALNEFTTLGVGNAIKEGELRDKVKVIGFDNNSIAVEMLEEGIIDGLMVQNQFAIGYLGIESAYNLITEKYILEREIYTDTTLVERENLFEESIQKIVFSVEKHE